MADTVPLTLSGWFLRNVVSLIALGTLIVGGVTTWNKIDYINTDQSKEIGKIYGILNTLATTKDLEQVRKDADRDNTEVRKLLEQSRSDNSATFSGINERISLLGTRTNETSNAIAGIMATLGFLQKRAGLTRDFSDPASSVSVPFATQVK